MLWQNLVIAKNGYVSPGLDYDLLICNTLSYIDIKGADNARAKYKAILRPKRNLSNLEIHYSIIALGNQVVKNTAMRDCLY